MQTTSVVGEAKILTEITSVSGTTRSRVTTDRNLVAGCYRMPGAPCLGRGLDA